MKTSNHMTRSGFSTTGFADYADDCAAVDCDINTIDCIDLASASIYLMQVFEFQNCMEFLRLLNPYPRLAFLYDSVFDIFCVCAVASSCM